MVKDRKQFYDEGKLRISLLWITVMIIMAFADIFNFVMPGYVNDLAAGTAYLHYYYFAGLETICMLGIIWLSWRKDRLEIKKGDHHES